MDEAFIEIIKKAYKEGYENGYDGAYEEPYQDSQIACWLESRTLADLLQFGGHEL